MKRICTIAGITIISCILFALGSRLVDRGIEKSRERPKSLTDEVNHLKQWSHPEWRIRKGWFCICTEDQASESNRWCFKLSSTNTGIQKFDQFIFKETGSIETAWISDWTPRSAMGKFEDFRVSSTHGAGFTIEARLHTNESVAMEFAVTFIVK